MRADYHVMINDVGGAFKGCTLKNPQAALNYLKSMDHEGALLHLSIELHSSEDVYKILEALKEGK